MRSPGTRELVTPEALWQSLGGGAAAQIGLDQEARTAAELRAIDLHVLEHALDVVARLGEWDAFDPVDRVDIRVARIAILFDPLPRAAASRIVGDERKNVGA